MPRLLPFQNLCFLLGAIAILGFGCATTATSPTGGAVLQPPPALEKVASRIEKESKHLADTVARVAKYHRQHGQDAASTLAYAEKLAPALPVTWIIDNAPSSQAGEVREIQSAMDRSTHATFSAAAVDADGVAADVSSTGGEVTTHVIISTLIGRIAEEEFSGTNVDCWVMDTSGFQVYDPDEHELGRNLLTDPLYDNYPEVRTLVRQIATDAAGTGAYTFLDTGLKNVVRKRAHWTTARFGDQEWRVVVVQLVSDRANEVLSSMQDMDVMWDLRSVRTLLAAPVWQAAFTAQDEAVVRERFRQVLADHPLIYSIACVYPDGIIRYGEPRENSFENYDLKAGKLERDAELLQAAAAPEESWLVYDLLEGGRGLFTVQPVRVNGQQAGAVYVVWLIPE
ncbi:MAG: hypothetical protein IT368_15920 [Candidatus Hydrogenedentes bacterium]|nr:hypothetical protein [Candidatus Hydrogenedentota bacterium]